MIILASAILGALSGTLTAKRRGGAGKDMLQYGAAYAIAFSLIGLVITIAIERSL